MPIEFHCPHCGKLLKTAEDKAGVRARCPDCQEVVTVPGAGAPSTDEPIVLPEASALAQPNSATQLPDGAGTESGAMKACPMCGAQIRAAATRCRYCGEVLDRSLIESLGMPRPIDAGDVLSQAWEIYKLRWGICMGIVLLAILLQIAAVVPVYAVVLLQANGELDESLALPMRLGFQLVQTLVGLYLSLGQTVAILKLARGENPHVGDLFSGGRWYVRAIVAGLLFTMLYACGFLACLVGALVVYLLFSPFRYFLVDRDAAAVESLKLALTATKPNILPLFLLWLASIGLVLLGYLACGVGVLVTWPYLVLADGVAYLLMTGQKTAVDRDLRAALDA